MSEEGNEDETDEAVEGGPEAVDQPLGRQVFEGGVHLIALAPGAESERGHREVGEEAATLGIDQLIAIGEMGEIITRAAQKAGLKKCLAVGSTSEAAETLDAIATPGHTQGHYVFADTEHGLLYAGDHVLPSITPSVGFEPRWVDQPLERARWRTVRRCG